MTKSKDGQWESPTEFDADARMDGDDQPTLTATPEQIEEGRALSARPDATPARPHRTTAQGLTAKEPRTPASGTAIAEEVITASFQRSEADDIDPASTARGLPVVEPRAPAANSSSSMPRANQSGSMAPAADTRTTGSRANRSGSMAPADSSGSIARAVDVGAGVSDGRVAHAREPRSGPTLTGLDSRGVRPPGDRSGGIPTSAVDANRSGGTSTNAVDANRSGGVSAHAVIAAAAASADDDFDPASTARGMPAQRRAPGPSGEVLLLDRVAPATDDAAARRTEAPAGGIVVVATGADGERVRRLCNAHSLLLPVMSSLSIAPGSLSVVLGEPSPPAPDRVLHVVRPSVPDAQLADLLRALVSGHVLVERPAQPTNPDPRAREFAQRLARMQDRAAIETTMIEAVTVLLDADRAYCWFFEPSSGALWSEGQRRTLGDNSRAMGGLVGWAAYTGQAIHASPPGDDPRFLLELDDPDGKPQSRMIVQPIIGGDRRVHALLVAVRRWRNTAFDDASLAAIADLATLCAPALDLVASTGPRAPKFRASTTIPGPLAAAARESAVVDARSKRPSSRPPPLTTATAPSTNGTTKPVDPRRARIAKALSGESAPIVVTPVTDTPSARVVAPTPSNAVPVPQPEPVVAPSAPSESRPIRTSTSQPPSTSNTGRTRAPTGERGPSQSGAVRQSQGALRSRPYQQVALVGGAEEHDRLGRVAKTCGIDAAIVASTELAPPEARIITFGQAWSPSLDPRVVYVARDTLSNDALADLMSAVSSGRVLGSPAQLTRPTNPNEARRAQQAFTGSRAFAGAASLAAAEASAITTMRELLDVDRAYFLYYDDEDGSLKSTLRAKDDRRAIAGIAGWVARTGRGVSTERAATDPRWLGPIDDPDGDANSQLLVEPVIVGERVRAVLVAARRPRRPGFVDADRDLIARFAALLAPLVDQLILHAEPSAAPPAPVAPVTSSRHKRATEQAIDDLREVQPSWKRLPVWAYAAGGLAVLGVIAMLASC